MGTIPPPPETKREPLPARGSRQEKAPNGTSWRGSRRRASRDPTSGSLLTSPPRTPPQGDPRLGVTASPCPRNFGERRGAPRAGGRGSEPGLGPAAASRPTFGAAGRSGGVSGCGGQPPRAAAAAAPARDKRPRPAGPEGALWTPLPSLRAPGRGEPGACAQAEGGPAGPGVQGGHGDPPKPALLSPRPQTARGSAPWVAVPGRPVPASQRRATAGAEGQSPRRSPSAVPRSARPAPPPAAPPGRSPGVGGRGCGGAPRALGACLRRSAGRRARRGLLTPGPRRRRRRRRARASRGSSAALWRSLALVPALTPTSAAGRPQPRPAEAPGRVPVSVAPRGAQSRPRLKPPRRPPED
ncbi:collagen alpha-2(I) chain-like [Ovis aries]|uniref:collagen alpha-2(I) chain-like n=1 Tax=Ovis aries TaxID=9940 RepID=UPI001C2EA6CD|nr:collagen alpha-2(I) chain-like [Ovis aries]